MSSVFENKYVKVKSQEIYAQRNDSGPFSRICFIIFKNVRLKKPYWSLNMFWFSLQRLCEKRFAVWVQERSVGSHVGNVSLVGISFLPKLENVDRFQLNSAVYNLTKSVHRTSNFTFGQGGGGARDSIVGTAVKLQDTILMLISELVLIT